MIPSEEELVSRAKAYAHDKRIVVDFQRPFGAGTDRNVWSTSRGSALKVIYRRKNYQNERDCYLRLQQAGIEHVGSFTVPRLVDFDDRSFAVEMGIVVPPFLLDFGKVYLDAPPPYWSDKQLMANFHADGKELFGENWKTVLSALATLRRLGIFYVDPKPGNISF